MKCNNTTIRSINRDNWDCDIIREYLVNGWIDDLPIALRLLDEANHKIYRLEKHNRHIKDTIMEAIK